MEPFSLLVKPVGGACNLDCGYCFYKEHPSGLMSAETADRMLSAYAELPFAEKSITLQGGEPLLAWKTGLFQRLNDFPVDKSLQTNATLVTDEVAALLARDRWLVGASLDGPRRLNRLRGDSFDAAVRGIRSLEAADADYNLLTVVSKANVSSPREVYRFLRDNFSTRFHQYVECTGPSEDIGGEEWGDFLVGLFDEWVKNDTRSVSVRLFDSIVSKLVLGRPTLCSQATTCRHYLVVEHDGSVYPCDFHVCDDLRLGNVMTDSFEEIVASPAYEHFASAKTANLPPRCGECEFLEFCNGDCPRSRQRLCRGWRKFFAHTLPRFRELAEDVVAGR